MLFCFLFPCLKLLRHPVSCKIVSFAHGAMLRSTFENVHAPLGNRADMNKFKLWPKGSLGPITNYYKKYAELCNDCLHGQVEMDKDY